MPPPDLKLSVFCVGGLPEGEIWRLGRVYVSEPQRKSLHGAAILAVRSVREQPDLDLVVDNQPPYHANITGWPAAKERQKVIAQELAAVASLRLSSSD